MLIVLTFTLSIFAQQQTVRVTVHSNAAADGTVLVADQYLNVIASNYNANFNEGITNFDFPISSSYDPATLYATAYGGTSWNAWYDTGYVQGFYGGYPPPTCHLYMYFGYPKDVSVFVETNSDVESGTVELFHMVGTQLSAETVKWDNDDYNSDGITEVIFHNIFDPDNCYEFMTAEAHGTNVYDEYLSLETSTNFVWNETETQWENDDIYMNYSLPVSEARNFKAGWNWKSFPRLFRSVNQPFEAEIVVDDLESHALLLEGKNPDDNWMEWDLLELIWNHNNEFYEFKSSDGLKLEMSSTYSDYDLDVYGTQLPELTSITLTGGNENNWVGYWLEETQTVKDAFGDYWRDENLTMVKAQNWCAVRYNGNWKFRIKEGYSPTISYGEMVIVNCITTINNFQWDNSTAEDERVTFSEPEYFSYEEQADYVPLFIELDSSNMPQEIGAKVNGVCIGATVVEDTLTQINAYTASAPPGDIELELYYGNRSENVNLSTYNCITSSQPNIILTKLSTKNRDDAWFVNLREGSSITPTPEKVSLDNYPNPFNPTTTIAYSLPNDGKIELRVFNIKGQIVKTLVEGDQQAGSYEVVWNGKDNNRKSVSSGIYFYKLTTKDKTIMKKMLLLK